MILSTLNEWLNESNNDGFLEPTKENLEKFGLYFDEVTINPDGSIDYGGSVYLSSKNLTKIPFKFNKVSRHFYCNLNQLTSLSGCPKEIGMDFSCYSNNLTSLSGGPVSVGGTFCCHSNQLTSLFGGPESVGGYFDCHLNQLTSLSGGPKSVGGYFDCCNNQLISLFGCPESIGKNFDFHNNLILYNPTKYPGPFDLDKKWKIKDSSGNWVAYTGKDHLKMAFERLDELSKEEILGIEEGLDKVGMPDDLRAYCQDQIFRWKVKHNPKTKFQKALSGAEDEIIDMF